MPGRRRDEGSGRIVSFPTELGLQMADDLDTLRSAYQSAKTAFLAANAAVTTQVANRKRPTVELMRELESAKRRLNAAGQALSAAERLTG